MPRDLSCRLFLSPGFHILSVLIHLGFVGTENPIPGEDSKREKKEK